MNEHDCLREETFRKVTVKNENNQLCYSYPMFINELARKGKVDI